MRASCSYQLIDNQGGGYCIGADGDDFAELVRCLKDLYGSRLVRIVDDQTGEVLDLRISNPAESGNDAAVSGEPPGETGPRGTVRSGTVQPNSDIAPPEISVPADPAEPGEPAPDANVGWAEERSPSIAKSPRADTAESADISSSTDPATRIITVLTAAGWQPAGCTQEEIIHSRNSGKPKFDEADRPITMGGRPRLRKGNRFVTVGARTTCFYQRTAGAPDGFRRIKTKDIAAVLAAAGEKPCTSIQPQN
jgi:hypothetical protein